MPDPYLRIRVDVYQPEENEDGLIYSLSRLQPLEWINNKRYDGYLTAEFQEMLDELRRALKLK